jgi:hypothetical protein
MLMKKNDAKTIAFGLNDLSESYVDLASAIKATTSAAHGTKKLWRDGKRSWLIKVGVALIAFPDPTISDVVGSAFVAAGLVQEGIRRRSLHADDVAKAFQRTMRELQGMSDCV